MTAEDKTKPIADLFDQAAKNYEQVLKTGLKLQQESAKLWTGVLGESGVPDVQGKCKALLDDLVPQTQKNINECLKLIEQNSRASVDLLKKAVAVTQSSSVQDSQAKVLNLWETSWNTACETTQAITQANTKAMETCIEYFRKNGMPAETAAKS
jgi:hypothetical protein